MRRPYLGFGLLPFAVLAYLGGIGYDLSFSASTVGVFVVSMGGFALAAALAVRAGAWTSVSLSLAVFALVPWLGDLGLGQHFVSFAAVVDALLFVAVGGVALIAIEYAVRNRERVLDSVSRRTLLRSFAIGIGHALAVVLVAEAAGDAVLGIATELFDAQPVEYAMLVLVVIGLVSLGAVPALLFARCRLRLPALVTAGAFAFATYRTWRYAQETAHVGASPSPMIVYAVFWFVPLALALVLGAFESLRSPGSRRRFPSH